MDYQQAINYLGDIALSSNQVYFRTEPEVLDFTCHAPGKLLISGSGKRVEIPVGRENIFRLASTLDVSIFTPGKTVIGWNVKSFFSYLRFYSGKYIPPGASIIDLQVIENFLDIRKEQPEKMSEVINRTKEISSHESWTKIYKKIHLPLMLEILPDMEAIPILDIENKISKHAYYQIEGQTGGRLLSYGKFSRSYIPHRLGPLEKDNLRPFGYGRLFMYADFRNCEVTVLQHLSQDNKLKELIESKEDFYSNIYQIVTGNVCSDVKTRNKSKLLFLPVMYGCGAKTLASNLGVSEDMAHLYISKIYEEFPVASQWMQQLQKAAKDKKTIHDYFGRPRKFEQPYKARNFVIQSTAATVCLEKLIAIYKEIKKAKLDLQAAFTVHDGFGFYVNPAEAKEAFDLTKGVLESESSICKGLKLTAKIEFGRNLNKMSVLWK